MTKIRFASGITVTIQNGLVSSPKMELTAILDAPGSTLPGYSTSAFELDGDFNIARGLVERIGAGKIVGC